MEPGDPNCENRNVDRTKPSAAGEDDDEHLELFGEVALARHLTTAACHDLELLLSSRGVPHRSVETSRGIALLTPTRYASKARRELARYRSENHDWPPPHDTLEPLTQGEAIIAILAGLLLSAYAVQSSRFLGFDWVKLGAAHGALIRDGAIERLFTPLLLHADIVHLASNLCFGALLLAALAQVVGSGSSLLLAVLAGAFGNVFTVFIHEPTFRAIGFSGAVFGALGALVGVRVASRNRMRWSKLQRFAPAFAALFLFSLFGIGDEQTDVLGHVGGLLGGFAIGIAYERFGLRHEAGEGRAVTELVSGCIALALLVVPWMVALAR